MPAVRPAACCSAVTPAGSATQSSVQKPHTSGAARLIDAATASTTAPTCCPRQPPSAPPSHGSGTGCAHCATAAAGCISSESATDSRPPPSTVSYAAEPSALSPARNATYSSTNDPPSTTLKPPHPQAGGTGSARSPPICTIWPRWIVSAVLMFAGAGSVPYPGAAAGGFPPFHGWLSDSRWPACFLCAQTRPPEVDGGLTSRAALTTDSLSSAAPFEVSFIFHRSEECL